MKILTISCLPRSTARCKGAYPKSRLYIKGTVSVISSDPLCKDSICNSTLNPFRIKKCEFLNCKECASHLCSETANEKKETKTLLSNSYLIRQSFQAVFRIHIILMWIRGSVSVMMDPDPGSDTDPDPDPDPDPR